jgi:thymidylate kinase
MTLDNAYALMVAPVLRAFSRGGGTKKIYVEGNVGAGKTTVVEELRRALEQRGSRACAFPEQTERWAHQKLLRDLYADGSDGAPGKRAFETLGPLRDFVDRKRFMDAHASEYDYAIFERHPRTTLRVFGANDDDATRGLYESVNAALPFMEPPELTVYLRVSPETCLSRARQRDRPEERDVVDIERLSEIHAKQERDVADREREGLAVMIVAGAETKSANEIVKMIMNRLN